MSEKRRKDYLTCPNDPTHQISEWDGRYDAFACYTCDLWTERNCNCSDANCEFKARQRPERPSMVSRYVEWQQRTCTCQHTGKDHMTTNAMCTECPCLGYLDEDTSYHTSAPFVSNK